MIFSNIILALLLEITLDRNLAVSLALIFYGILNYSDGKKY